MPVAEMSINHAQKRTKMIDIIEYTETKVEMGRTYSKHEGQYLDQTLHRVASNKMSRRHNKEGRNYLEQERNRQKAIDGGLHPAVDEQSLVER